MRATVRYPNPRTFHFGFLLASRVYGHFNFVVLLYGNRIAAAAAAAAADFAQTGFAFVAVVVKLESQVQSHSSSQTEQSFSNSLCLSALMNRCYNFSIDRQARE